MGLFRLKRPLGTQPPHLRVLVAERCLVGLGLAVPVGMGVFNVFEGEIGGVCAWRFALGALKLLPVPLHLPRVA